MTTALFLLKLRSDYSEDPSYSGSYQIATGMWNSAKFVTDVLNENFIDSAVALTTDGNTVDAVVMQNNPKIVFVEGLWVTPEKLAELQNLPRHAARTFVVRIHSEIPFLATEGVAMGWISRYLANGTTVAPNSPRSHNEICNYARALGYSEDFILQHIVYLPNCYPTDFRAIETTEFISKPILDVACFGAFRPMKNHLFSALLAIRFAKSLGKTLRFHINDRIDSSGQGPSNNIEGLFASLPTDQFELVRHGWEDRDTFLQSLVDVDILFQISLSETFNIVAADATWAGRPVLGSDEISWLYPLFADPNEQDKALQVLQTQWSNRPFFVQQNRDRLKTYAKKSELVWVRYVSSV